MSKPRPFVIRHKDTNKYWATCGLTKYPSRAYTFDTIEEAQTEITWNIQHPTDLFATGTYEVIPLPYS